MAKTWFLINLAILACLFGWCSTSFGQQLVNMYVTVVNEQGQLIKGMKAENFKLLENNKAREIKFFTAESEPASVAIVFDLSASVTHNETDSKIKRVGWFRKSALDYIGLTRVDNEYTLLSFGEEISSIADFVSSGTAKEIINDDTKFIRPKKDGTTPLFVAVKAAIEKLEKSKLARHILLVMTDGNDNASAQKVKSEVDLAVRSSLIPIFTLAAYDPSTRDPDPAAHAEPRIASVSYDSGGGFFVAKSETDARNIMMRVATIVENQYHLGFVPEQPVDQNKVRKLEVRLEIDKVDEKAFQYPTPLYSKRYIPSM